jgi:hypothetical protein
MARGIGLTFSMANFRCFPTLGQELGVDLEYRRTGGLVGIGADQWERMAKYAATQREIGLSMGPRHDGRSPRFIPGFAARFSPSMAG